MRFLRADGTVFGGAEAVLEISRHIWWAWPLRQAGRVPVFVRLLRSGYRWLARNRACPCRVSGTRGLITARQIRPIDVLPLLILPTAALTLRAQFPPWVFMWAMALAIYAGCKWLTFRAAAAPGPSFSLARALGYLLAWPGMEASIFLNRQDSPAKPSGREWALAFANTCLGFAVLFGVSRRLLPIHPLAAGWAGMCGVVFILHFGLFHLLSLTWRRAGVKASPLMQNPMATKSLSEFWGGRWNTAFNELAFRYIYRPVRRRTTPAFATLAAFGLSGLVHELVISLPARGGFGLPTTYFMIQGLGMLLERSAFGQQIGLDKGLPGRAFALTIAAGPAVLLFPPPFIRNVILPMLSAIGAT
jgi:alginate O-acetyltransferase complex protein AlgI